MRQVVVFCLLAFVAPSAFANGVDDLGEAVNKAAAACSKFTDRASKEERAEAAKKGYILVCQMVSAALPRQSAKEEAQSLDNAVSSGLGAIADLYK